MIDIESAYNIEDTAFEALIHLLNDDYEFLNQVGTLSNIEYLYKLAEVFKESYEQSEDYQPDFLYLVGKQIEEFGARLKDLAKDDAVEIYKELFEETGEQTHFLADNKLTLAIRQNVKVIPNERLERLEEKFTGIKRAIKQEKKRLEDDGQVESTNPTYSLTVSKS